MQDTLNTAIAYHQAGRFEEAEAEYRNVLAFDPNIATVYSNLGLILQNTGRTKEAIMSYRKALTLDRTSPYIYRNLALLYIETGDKQNAAKCLHAALDLTLLTSNYELVRSELANDYISGIEDPVTGSGAVVNKYDYTAIPPIRIRIESAGTCNLRCRHCPTGTAYRDMDRHVMNSHLFNKIIEYVKKTPTIRQAILYLGGEPLLNKNLPEMCRRIKLETQVTYTHFNTNGMLLNDDIIEQLTDADVNKIIVSIDGRSPAENDNIRKGAKYSIIYKNVKKLCAGLKNTQIEIANTIIKQHGDPDIPETPTFLKNAFGDIPIESRYAMKWPGLNIKKSGIPQIKSYRDLPKAFCSMPFNQIAIRANGDIVPCCYDLSGQNIIGNIHKEELLTIWNNQTYCDLRKNIYENNINELPVPCRRCVIYSGEAPIVQGARETEWGSF